MFALWFVADFVVVGVQLRLLLRGSGERFRILLLLLDQEPFLLDQGRVDSHALDAEPGGPGRGSLGPLLPPEIGHSSPTAVGPPSAGTGPPRGSGPAI